jgi:class 3 adenylate cyclase/tetratricopeptide (TPR) repeat protein
MTCLACGQENPAGTKFCSECGARLALVCPACRTANPLTGKFCSECGQRLSAEAPPARVEPPAPPPPALPERFASPHAYTPKHLAEKILTSRSAIEGERKQVTVLFTDVSGFTKMSTLVDPEDIHEIMDRAFEVILDAVHRSEGTINQFLGDGVMALFGAPIAHEDHAHRALRAALAIQDGLQALRKDVWRNHHTDFRMRIGINTGLVVVGAIGRDLRMDYTAVGETTNLAARLLNVAQPGQIALGERTRRLADGYFAFDDLGEFQVKGKDEPIRAWAVTAELRGRTRLEVSRERGLTPLAGRAAELDALQRAYAGVDEQHGRVVLVRGEAGAGKSRLLYEFLARIADEPPAVELTASCVAHGASIPFYPVIELVNQALRIPAGLPEADLRRAVDDAVRRFTPDEDTAALVAHFLGVPAPPELLNRLAGEQLKTRTFEVLVQTLLASAGGRLLIVVVEDIHWLDASSVAFLGQLVPALRERRALLLLTARSGDALPASLPADLSVSVAGLTLEDIAAMVTAILDVEAATPDLLEFLRAKSEGNPLYVEELIHQLSETHAVTIADGRAQLVDATVDVPATVHDLIAARVDRLPEAMKQTVQTAAVVGREFEARLVARVGGRPESDVDADLAALAEREFIFLGDAADTWLFKHALTQEVVYASLLERRRRRTHGTVGHELEALHASRLADVVELLAHHFGRSPEDEPAVDYALLAAEKAQRRWANPEALGYFESALKRLDGAGDTPANRLRRIDAVVKQAEVKFALARHAEHVQALEAIRDIVEQHGDPPRRAAWYYWTGFLGSLTGAPPDVSIDYCRRAVEIAEAAGLDELRPFAECALAHVYVYAGDLAHTIEAGRRALETFEARGNLWWASRALWALSPAANARGDWRASLDYCEKAVEYARATDDLRLKVVGWWRTGSSYIQQGDAAAGLRCCDEAFRLSPAPFDAAMTRAVRGFGHLKLGDTVTAIAELEEAVAWFDAHKLRYTKAAVAVWLADAYVAAGDRARARAIAAEALETSQTVGARYLEARAERVLGTACLDEPAAAAPHLDRAAAISEDIGAHDELARTLTARAALHAAAGDRAAARTLLERAVVLFDSCQTLDEPARVREQLAAL